MQWKPFLIFRRALKIIHCRWGERTREPFLYLKRFLPILFIAVITSCANPQAQSSHSTKPANLAPPSQPQLSECGIIRGSRAEKKIVLVFTGHTFGEGGDIILNQLARHHAKASFFLTGEFLDNPQFTPVVKRIVAERHYLGPHSNEHLLYCPWTGPKTNLITREDFDADLAANLEKIRRFTGDAVRIHYFLPPYEYYNCDIVRWSKEDFGLTLINYTPGTRSNADYLEEKEKNFVSSQAIYDSILKKESTSTDGLNGFILLTHIGAGPGRSDKFFNRFGALLDELQSRGYKFVRVDELLERGK